jgi:single-stranded-DNA-specific exonuclease
MFKEAVRLVEQDPHWAQERVLVVSSAQWHEGVMGIVAARLCERFNRPSVVIAERDGAGKGSGRTIPGVSIHALVQRCESLLTSFGGHDQACGLTLPAERIPEFRRTLARCARETEKAGAVRAVEIEAELRTADLTADFVKALERLEPFGPGNAKPVFLTKGLKLKASVQKRGRDTLSGWVTDADGKAACELVGFRCYERFSRETPKAAWDFAYRPTLRTHAGIASIQLELIDWA